VGDRADIIMDDSKESPEAMANLRRKRGAVMKYINMKHKDTEDKQNAVLGWEKEGAPEQGRSSG